MQETNNLDKAKSIMFLASALTRDLVRGNDEKTAQEWRWRLLRLCRGLLACCWLGLAVAEEPSFELGVLPNMETVELIRQYQPLASYLREQLGMPVLVRTRATYDRFARAAQAGEFDLIVTAPHLARLAEQEGGLRPLVSFAGELRLVAVLPAGSSLEELRARPVLTMAVPDRIAWVALMGEAWLAQQMPQAEIRLRAYRSHRNAVRAVQQGESDITFIGP